MNENSINANNLTIVSSRPTCIFYRSTQSINGFFSSFCANCRLRRTTRKLKKKVQQRATTARPLFHVMSLLAQIYSINCRIEMKITHKSSF